MAKFRKKPVEVEAIQWTGLNLSEVKDFVTKDCLVAEITTDAAWRVGVAPPVVDMKVNTPEGWVNVSVDDYIIKGVANEFYPCKPDIFEKTYNLVESGDESVRDRLTKLIGACKWWGSIEEMVDYLLANGVTVQEWIPASEPPEEHDSIWARLYGTKSWQPGLFRKCSYDVIACVEKKDGSRRTISIRTYDGKWDRNKLNEETVICWRPMPQPPKEGEKDAN